VEIGGRLEKGTYDYPFSFKNIELEMDSYNGIALNVDYSVTVEMVYTG
jgi:Vacuolar protein sorting-associated protein 26